MLVSSRAAQHKYYGKALGIGCVYVFSGATSSLFRIPGFGQELAW